MKTVLEITNISIPTDSFSPMLTVKVTKANVSAIVEVVCSKQCANRLIDTAEAVREAVKSLSERGNPICGR